MGMADELADAREWVSNILHVVLRTVRELTWIGTGCYQTQHGRRQDWICF